jgi:hypothetical protein
MEIIKLNAVSKEECLELLQMRRKEINSQLQMSTSSIPNGYNYAAVYP